MSKVDEAARILAALGLPRAQQQERSSLTLLALANLGRKSQWKNAAQPLLRTVDIMAFMREQYGKDYAPNSRETVRRQTLHQFEQARIVDRNPDDPSRPTNSGKNCYGLTDDIISVLRAFGAKAFDREVAAYLARYGSLQEAYRQRRKSRQVPLVLPNGDTVFLSPGKHNALQIALIEEFGPRFAPGACVLYVGDTAKKHVVYDEERLAALMIRITEHDKLPDIVLYDEERNWLFLIEAVTSHGPLSPKRHHEVEAMLAGCTVERVYVTGFLEMRTFRKYAGEIAWETEVWVAEHPDHMIHFNGPKFLGPYKPRSETDERPR